MSATKDADREVAVCSACLCASCWHGEFYCGAYKTAATVKRTVRQLRELNREHPSHYSLAKVRRVCGS